MQPAYSICALGILLSGILYDGLGGDQDSACITCHHPMLGGGDNLSLSIGVEAEQNRDAGKPAIQNISLSDKQINQLVAFIKTLTDPCVKDRACMADWIPDAGDANPDGLRVDAFDLNGDPL